MRPDERVSAPALAMRTRDEHLAWCKKRALAKHPGTKQHTESPLMLLGHIRRRHVLTKLAFLVFNQLRLFPLL